jgi:hypothetical protein
MDILGYNNRIINMSRYKITDQQLSHAKRYTFPVFAALHKRSTGPGPKARLYVGPWIRAQ